MTSVAPRDDDFSRDYNIMNTFAGVNRTKTNAIDGVRVESSITRVDNHSSMLVKSYFDNGKVCLVWFCR